MYIVDPLAIHFVDSAPGRHKVALDPSGKSGASRHHRKDYTARTDSAAGFLICGVLIEKAVLFYRNLSAAFSANLTRRAT
jgi:hypothetical protein